METKIRILEGAKELFYKYGIKTVTMDDVASHLGMSKKTIYKHYRDKGDLVIHVSKFDLDKRRLEIEKIMKSPDNAILEMVEMIKYTIEILKNINPAKIYEMQKFHPAAWDQFLKFKNGFLYSCFYENLRKGIREGLYRKDINLQVMARFRIETIELAFNPVAFPPVEFELSEVHVSILDHYLHGIATDKGHALIKQIFTR